MVSTANHAKAVRLDLLRPGDVILSRGTGFRSAATVAFQLRLGSKERIWSHAAIVIDSCHWLESTGDGIQIRHVPWDKIEIHDNEFRALHFLPSDYQRLSVWRHQLLDAVPGSGRAQHVYQTLMCEARKHLHHEYSNLERLADATLIRNSAFLRRAVFDVNAMATKFKLLPKKIIPGAFCSELVSLMYDDLKLKAYLHHVDLLKTPLKPYEVGPCDIGDPEISNLLEVNEAVTLENGSLPSIQTWRPRDLPTSIRPEYRRGSSWEKEAPENSIAIIDANKSVAMLKEILDQVSPETRDSHDVNSDGISDEQALINRLFGSFDQEMRGSGEIERMMELSKRMTILIDHKMSGLQAVAPA